MRVRWRFGDRLDGTARQAGRCTEYHRSDVPTTVATQAPASTAPPAPSSGSGSVPTYQPSTMVSQASGHTQLTSTDGVGQVTAFCENALETDGWSPSSTKTATSANFVAHRSGEGATVAISTLGSGTTISISTYPQ